MKRILFLLLLLVSHFAYSQTLRLAVYQYADNPRINNLQPLANLLQQRLGITATVKSYPNVHALIEAIQKGETDIAFINTFGYLMLESSGKRYPMQPKVALAVPNPEDNYKTLFVTRAESPIEKLKDAATVGKQTRLGLVATGSTSGNLVPRLALTRAGIADAEQHFQSVRYTGTHEKAIQALLNNEVDLAAMGNNEYTKLDSITKVQLKPIWISTEIPLGPVLFHKKLSKQLQSQVEQVLLTSHQEAPVVLESIKAAWSEAKQATHFDPITKDNYLPFLIQFGTMKDIQPILKQFAN
jgi:phosphate/phosphite/phosphonate ABC transporter binding protein